MSRETGSDDLVLLLIDGDNLLHHVRGGRDEGGVAWLLPRLARWRPPHLQVIVGLDGHPAPGERARTKAAPGITFRHSGSRSADDLLVALLKQQPYADRSRTAVVTRDSALQARVHRAGGRTRSTAWLERRIAAGDRPAVGSRPAAGPGPASPEASDEPERAPWQPGRGATRKKGNPRRSPKPSRRR